MTRSGRAQPAGPIKCELCGIEIYPHFNLGVWLHKWGSELCSDARVDEREFEGTSASRETSDG